MNIISRIVGRCHVGDSNREVCSYVVSRIKKSAWGKMPLGRRVGILRKAIDCHRENQSVYCSVMGGCL